MNDTFEYIAFGSIFILCAVALVLLIYSFAMGLAVLNVT